MQHRIAAVELFITTESVTAKQRVFRQHIQRRDAPGRNTLLLLVPKWRRAESVEDSKPLGCLLSARTPDNMGPLMNVMLRRPSRSARQQALPLRLKKFSVRLKGSALPFVQNPSCSGT